jgi:hypothetical protein
MVKLGRNVKGFALYSPPLRRRDREKNWGDSEKGLIAAEAVVYPALGFFIIIFGDEDG